MKKSFDFQRSVLSLQAAFLLLDKRSQSQIKNGDILLSYIGLLCQGKTIYVGSLWKAVNYTDVEGNSKTVTTRIVYKVIERTMDKNGQLLIMPDIE